MAFASGSAFSAVKPLLASVFRPRSIQSCAESWSAIGSSPRCRTIHKCIDSRQRLPIFHTLLYGRAMEVPMRDLLLQGAGVVAILVSIAHGVLGETHVFARATVEPPRLRT